MKQGVDHIPVYRQFISLIEDGLSLLDDEAIILIKKFIEEKQHVSGGFVDRGEAPDLYYSMFGFFLSSALKLDTQLDLLKSFISEEKRKNHNPVETFSFMLIDSALSSVKYGVWKLIRESTVKGYTANFAYQIFLLFLVADAGGKRMGILRFFMRIWIKFYNPRENVPCSMIAALTVAKKELGIKTKSEQLELIDYFDDECGFRAFTHAEVCDMLSTAVALFALRKTDFDLRLVASVCLNFIQGNFEEGAFLSGDGDTTRDLEYTFYGLLALGCLANDDNQKLN